MQWAVLCFWFLCVSLEFDLESSVFENDRAVKQSSPHSVLAFAELFISEFCGILSHGLIKGHIFLLESCLALYSDVSFCQSRQYPRRKVLFKKQPSNLKWACLIKK